MTNRPIKFRAWHKVLKEMTEVKSIHFNDDTIRLSIKPQTKVTKDTIMVQIDEVDVMQFTGLKDKNGKKIYEGDLFDCNYKFDGCNKHKLEVVWDEASASFKLKGHGRCHQPNVSKTVGDLYNLEVIGNVWENPELLSTN